MQRFLLCICFLLSQVVGFSQRDSTCNLSINSFAVGEEVKYRAYYNWNFIWLRAGDVYFSVKDTVYNSQSAYYFVSRGWSLKEYDWFFKVRDNFEAIVSKEDFKPLWFLRETYEGGFNTYNRYEFDYNLNQVNIVSYTSKRPYHEDIKKLQPCTFDVLSAIYHCRNIDFNHYEIDSAIPLSMVIDNDIFNLFIRYKGKETLRLRDGSKHKTIKFSVMLVEGTIFSGGEDMTVWVSDDNNRVPIMVEAKILIGSVKAILTQTKGLRND
ncbi:MAG: DUF3108 domain-containing protein [Bacteroidales bacterium]